MKALAVLIATLLLTACTSKDVRKAEHVLELFQCTNIESSQVAHTGISQYYEQSLYSSKNKATSYIEQYKNGQTTFDIPLTDMVEQQYELYKSACQNLGGIPLKK